MRKTGQPEQAIHAQQTPIQVMVRRNLEAFHDNTMARLGEFTLLSSARPVTSTSSRQDSINMLKSGTHGQAVFRE
jgi:hypothetical protein